MVKRRKIVTTVYLDPGQLDDLGKLAELDKTNRSFLIREALANYLEKRKSELPTKSELSTRQSSFFDDDIQ